MTQYDKMFIQDILIKINRGLQLIINAANKIEGFDLTPVRDKLNEVTNIVNTIQWDTDEMSEAYQQIQMGLQSITKASYEIENFTNIDVDVVRQNLSMIAEAIQNIKIETTKEDNL